MTTPADYSLPESTVGLTGKVDKVAPGTLPLRGDLAHVALASRYLAAHYVIPLCRTIGSADVILKTAMREDADKGATVKAGETVELLDCAGDWAWITRGPEGPSGYVHLADLTPSE